MPPWGRCALAGRLGALERIDVLASNAGLMAGQRRVTTDGFEEVLAVNHLAPFLLTSLLLGKLTAAAPARVISVTDAHTAARLDLDDPQLERGWERARAAAFLAPPHDWGGKSAASCAIPMATLSNSARQYLTKRGR